MRKDDGSQVHVLLAFGWLANLAKDTRMHSEG